MKKIVTILAAGVMSFSLVAPANAETGEFRNFGTNCSTSGYKTVVNVVAKQATSNSTQAHEVLVELNKYVNGRIVRIPTGTTGSFAVDAERLRPPSNLPANIDYATGKWKRIRPFKLQVGTWFYPNPLNTRSVYGNRLKFRATIKEPGKAAVSCKPREIVYSNTFS